MTRRWGGIQQADPLGFVDGPGVYNYVNGSPVMKVDADGRMKVGPMSTPPNPGKPKQCSSGICDLVWQAPYGIGSRCFYICTDGTTRWLSEPIGRCPRHIVLE